MKWKYGLTEDAYNALRRKQNGRCAICQKSEKEAKRPGRSRLNGKATVGLVVDHDHSTGAVRGLLCNRCNRATGAFEDNPDLLIAAAKYLRKT